MSAALRHFWCVIATNSTSHYFKVEVSDEVKTVAQLIKWCVLNVRDKITIMIMIMAVLLLLAADESSGMEVVHLLMLTLLPNARAGRRRAT